MRRTELRSPIIDGNKITFYLLKFHAKISILKNDKQIYFQATITDSKREDIILNFNTLEETITFIEETVKKCNNNIEVMDKYTEMNNIKMNSQTITLTKEEVKEALINHFGKEYKVSIEEKPYMFKDQLDVTYYLTKHNANIKPEDRVTIITNLGLKQALDEYLNNKYKIVDFKIITKEEDKNIYEGIELKVLDRIKEQRRRLYDRN